MRSIILLLAFGLSFAIRPSLASADASDLAAAEALFKEGQRLIKADQWEAACEKFEASIAADPSPGTWGQLAMCYEHLGRMADAWGAWERVKVQAENDAQRDYATERMAAIGPDLPYLKIEVADRSPGLVVERDGRALSAGEIGTEVPVNVGMHRVVVSAPDRVPQTKTIEVTAREHAELRFEDPLVVVERPVVVIERPVIMPARRIPWISISIVGSGLAGLGVSGVIGLSARSERDRARDLGCADDLSDCTTEGFVHAGLASSRAGIATGVAIGSAAVAIAGIVYYVVSDRKDRKPARQAWVVPLGSTGAMVGFGGSL